MTSRTMRTTTRSTAILATTAGLLLTSVGAASAQTVINKDQRGDVAEISNAGDVSPAPGEVNGDITRTRLWYAKKVGVVLHFVDLKKPFISRGENLEIDTNEGVQRLVSLDAGPGQYAGSTTMSDGDGQVKCKGITHKIDYKANTVDIRVPRSCLSNPRWVQIGVASYLVTDTGDGTGKNTADDALRDGPVTDLGDLLTMSRRIHRVK